MENGMCPVSRLLDAIGCDASLTMLLFSLLHFLSSIHRRRVAALDEDQCLLLVLRAIAPLAFGYLLKAGMG